MAPQISTNTDKAGKHAWDELWTKSHTLPAPVDTASNSLNNHVNSEFHRFFKEIQNENKTPNGIKFLEIGCGRSYWLPYFAREYGFDVTGIDYSEIGCELAGKMLEREGVTGRIVKCDFFDPPENLIDAFDEVFSFGVAEHFEDTAGCISAFSRYLGSGGIMITVIPNMVGIVGSLQKLMNRECFDRHVPLSREQISMAHQQAGLSLIACSYFLVANFGVVNFDSWKEARPLGPLAHKIVERMFFDVSRALWLLRRITPFFGSNRHTSPYIVCVARKP